MSQKHSHLTVKKGTSLYGVAIRNPDAYKEGEWVIDLYRRESIRDRRAEDARSYMPLVRTFEIDIAGAVGLN